MTELRVGIDLGTTFSTVGLVDAEGRVELIADNNSKLVPSMVWVKSDGSVSVGHTAESAQRRTGAIVLKDVKRLRGLSYAKAEPLWNGNGTVKMEQDDKGRPLFLIRDEHIPPIVIEALVLRELIRMAEEHERRPVTGAVIAVPANFSLGQIVATRQAATIAGITEVSRIIAEPTAAAVHYCKSMDVNDNRIGVFDCGGGTTDFTDLSAHLLGWAVNGTRGLKRLGGRDFTACLVDHLTDQLRKKNVQLTDSLRLQVASEADRVKRELTDNEEATAQLVTPNGDEELTVTRVQFEGLIGDLVKEAVDVVQQEMNLLGVGRDDYDYVLLAGGSCKLPIVKREMSLLFGKEPLVRNVDEAVGLGAAQVAAMSAANANSLTDVTPRAIGVEAWDKERLNEEGVKGAWYNHIMVSKNCSYPCTPSPVDFVTEKDGQEYIEGDVFEGESENPSECDIIGHIKYEIPDGANRKKGTKIQLRYTIDQLGTLRIQAKMGKKILHDKTIDMGTHNLEPSDIDEWRAWVREKIPLPFGDAAEMKAEQVQEDEEEDLEMAENQILSDDGSAADEFEETGESSSKIKLKGPTKRKKAGSSKNSKKKRH